MANCLSFFGLVCLTREMQESLKTKERFEEEVWDIFYFYSSLRADYTKAFSGFPLPVLLLN